MVLVVKFGVPDKTIFFVKGQNTFVRFCPTAQPLGLEFASQTP
jgi:hypothetical protein